MHPIFIIHKQLYTVIWNIQYVGYSNLWNFLVGRKVVWGNYDFSPWKDTKWSLIRNILSCISILEVVNVAKFLWRRKECHRKWNSKIISLQLLYVFTSYPRVIRFQKNEIAVLWRWFSSCNFIMIWNYKIFYSLQII